MTSQITEARNPLKTRPHLRSRVFEQLFAGVWVKIWEPDLGPFAVCEFVPVLRPRFAAFSFVVELCGSRTETDTQGGVKRGRGSLLGQLVRPFISLVTSMGFDPVNSKIVSLAVFINFTKRPEALFGPSV